MMKNIILMLLSLISLTALGQNKLGREYAKDVLKDILNNAPAHNVIDNKTLLLPDSITAIKVAEPLLFQLYGWDNILKQKPYESYFIDNYWVIIGTMPKDKMGGVFLIVLDARDCRVLRITHGK